MIKDATELPTGLVPTTYKKGKIERLVTTCVQPATWFTVARGSLKRVEDEAKRQGKRFEFLEEPRNPSQIYCKYLGPVEQPKEQKAPQNDPVWEEEAEALSNGV